MDCPKCGNALAPFDTVCPRCEKWSRIELSDADDQATDEHVNDKLASKARTPSPLGPVALFDCPACGRGVSSQANACPNCGQPFYLAGSVQSGPRPFTAGEASNDSGIGSTAILPDELHGWNWGAFFGGFLWSVFHSTWIGLLTLVPYAGFAMWFVLGIKGNEWAWQNRRWSSIDEFKYVQRQWAIWGAVLILVAIAFLIVVSVNNSINSSNEYMQDQ
jgi:DNA-directed RNA polymerase subunit M/transcription elongation factor TFIIS